MKVLFAVSNESISESIVKKYQKDYKEIISYKNVYYFNAILKEIEKDKSYDRIVISEDLEPFANNNYETIDRFLFERLDGISDEASNGEGTDIPIILICTDRRSKSDNLLLKIFSIGIYNAIIGQDRSIDEVCNLINKPRTKKDAKIYYKIDVDDASYQSEDEESVSEAEIQNIIAHYKRLGKNTERYVDSFNNIASQYTTQQLKVIVRFLPLNVKAVLESESSRYQEVIAYSNGKKKKVKAQARVRQLQPGEKKAPRLEDIRIELLESKQDKAEEMSNVVIPSGINTSTVKKQKIEPVEDKIEFDELEPVQQEKEQTVKRGRGRPKKVVIDIEQEEIAKNPKRGRGRPKKLQEDVETSKKDYKEKFIQEDAEIIEDADDSQPIDLFGLSDNDNDNDNYSKTNDYSLDTDSYSNGFDYNIPQTNQIKKSLNDISYDFVNIENLITKDKKLVAFVGAPKNGTSFLVNNLAFQLSQMGINTAILDVTKNKNSYYIYTNNEENLRRIAFDCIDKLKEGIASGIEMSKNLTVYTSLPGDNKDLDGIGSILSTIIQKHSLVLMDCDLNTSIQYISNAQEIYLVQSMDVLTIQPLTAFLRELKTKNILQPEKLRIVINKEVKVKGLTPKRLIGGMSSYKEPAMTFMTELFDKEKILNKYCTIPFEIENYEKYLEALVDCHISVNAYSKTFLSSLKALSNMVYPLLSRQSYESNVISNNYDVEDNLKSKGLFKFKSR